NVGLVPYFRAQAIYGAVIVGGKKIRPVLGPLLVEMINSSLLGDCGRKDHDRCERNERPNESLRARGWKVLRHFERDGQIESSPDRQRLGQIAIDELELTELVWRHPVAINTDQIGHPMGLECREPISATAPDVDNRSRPRQFQDDRNNLGGRSYDSVS